MDGVKIRSRMVRHLYKMIVGISIWVVIAMYFIHNNSTQPVSIPMVTTHNFTSMIPMVTKHNFTSNTKEVKPAEWNWNWSNDYIPKGPKRHIPFHIFQIGFDKCATTTFARFFKSNRIKALHFGYNGTPLRHFIEEQFAENGSISMDFEVNNEPVSVYCDFEANVPLLQTKQYTIYPIHVLFERYSNAKFILNIRSVFHWIKSQYHQYRKLKGCFQTDCVRKESHDETMSDFEIVQIWMQRWYLYNCEVLHFFATMNATHNLLIFDVEQDSVDKLITFFNKHNLSLNGTYWRHWHKTKEKVSELQQAQMIKWEILTAKYPDLVPSDEALGRTSEYMRIIKKCKSFEPQTQLLITKGINTRTETNIIRNHALSSKDTNNVSLPRIETNLRRKKFPFHIFQIGFNKCGTETFTQFFKHNHVATVHFGYEGVPLRKFMDRRYANNESVILDFEEYFMVFLDFESFAPFVDDPLVYNKIYPMHVLIEQYPNATFILNIRNVYHWIKSRYNHYGRIVKCFLNDCERRHFPEENMSDIDVVKLWLQEWYQYNCIVLDFFTKMNATHKLLVYDVEKDSVEKIIDFFSAYNLKLEGEYWGHSHQTQKLLTSKQHIVQMKKWEQLAQQYPNVLPSDEDLGNETEFMRIIKACNTLS